MGDTLENSTLQRITEADVASVMTLMNTAYRGSRSATAWTSEADFISGDRASEAQLREMQGSADAHFLKLCDDNGGLIGCVWLEPFDGETWYLGSLAIDPEQQNRGTGRALLSAAEAWVEARGGTRVRITVINVRDTLISWYLRRGYRPTGEREPFPYGDPQVGLPTRDDLEFVVLEKNLAVAHA